MLPVRPLVRSVPNVHSSFSSIEWLGPFTAHKASAPPSAVRETNTRQTHSDQTLCCYRKLPTLLRRCEYSGFGIAAYTLGGMLEVLLAALLCAQTAPADLHHRGVELYKQQNYTEAIEVLEKAVDSEAQDSAEYRESVLLIGQSYFMLSQAPKAIPWLEKAPHQNEANYMLGYAWLQAGQPERSEEAFARLFDLKPDSAAGHLLAGQMMLKKELVEPAVSEIHKALELDPKLSQAHYLLAEVDIAHGHFEEAIAELKQELVVDPNFSMAWYRLGDAYARMEQWDPAIAHLQRAVWLNPTFSGPLILLGRCYFKTGNLENAEGVLRRALVLDPENLDANLFLSRTLIAEGKTDEGKALVQKLKTLPQRQ